MAGGIVTSTGRDPNADPIVAHHVTLAFQPGPPGVKGAWADGSVADRKFRGFVGRYASQEGDVRIELLEETASGQLIVVKRWTKDRGEETRPRS
ncbi:hypothetical protein [Streptomyces sp. NBC_00162]|uniref:hypothetical protein n=1 Tax=Streptomyces sp. NBC_00162 TaxID=2903629 RepID=UPI00214AAA25|nr:hypothetical protein [Streptomyces sp. NBC_00162]UUU37508.1 hypothetical protein JIW86_00315 [Streptomyces sp. NBC_00162]